MPARFMTFALMLLCGAPLLASTQPTAQDGSPVLASGAKGPAVARAQALLDRAWFSPGEIDGVFSDNMRKAVLAYQQAKDLRTTGRVDAATWQALADESGSGMTTYRISEADVAGPYEKIPADMMQRATLSRLGYESIEEALGERFHVSPALLRQMNKGKRFVANEEIVVPDVAGTKPAAKVTGVIVLKALRVLQLVDQDGRVVAQFPVSFGGPRDPLPIGRMKIANEVKDPTFTYDPALLKDAKPTYTKVDIPAGPNNPVGNLWIGLSKPHWGIHGTPAPSKVGRMGTNGCLHLTNWDAAKVSSAVAAGYVVDVREQ